MKCIKIKILLLNPQTTPPNKFIPMNKTGNYYRIKGNNDCLFCPLFIRASVGSTNISGSPRETEGQKKRVGVKISSSSLAWVKAPGCLL